ncbi:MAG: glycosyltransferase [Sulfitobacter sp.]
MSQLKNILSVLSRRLSRAGSKPRRPQKIDPSGQLRAAVQNALKREDFETIEKLRPQLEALLPAKGNRGLYRKIFVTAEKALRAQAGAEGGTLISPQAAALHQSLNTDLADMAQVQQFEKQGHILAAYTLLHAAQGADHPASRAFLAGLETAHAQGDAARALPQVATELLALGAIGTARHLTQAAASFGARASSRREDFTLIWDFLYHPAGKRSPAKAEAFVAATTRIFDSAEVKDLPPLVQAMAFRHLLFLTGLTALLSRADALAWGASIRQDVMQGDRSALMTEIAVKLCQQGAAALVPLRVLPALNPVDLSPPQRLRLSRALRAAGDLSCSGFLLDQAMLATPAGQRELAMTLHSQGEPRKAQAIWEALLESDPETYAENLKGYLAALRMGEGEVAAEQVLLELIARAPGDEPRLTALALTAQGLASARAQPALAALAQSLPQRGRETLAALVPGLAQLGGSAAQITALAREWQSAAPDTPAPRDFLNQATTAIKLAERLALPGGAALSPAEIGIRALLHIAAAQKPGRASGGAAYILPSLGPGGIQRQVFNTLSGLNKHPASPLPPLVIPASMQGANTDFYQSRIAQIGAKVAAPPPEFYQPQLTGLHAADDIRLALSLLPPGVAREIGYFTDLFVQAQPALVHTWYDPLNISGGIAACLAGVPRIFLGARSMAPRGRRLEIAHVTCGYQQLIREPAVHILTLSQSSADDFGDWLSIGADKITPIYLGVDPESFDFPTLETRKRDLRQRLNFAPTAPVIASAFRFSAVKRPYLWLEGAAELLRRRPDARFLLMGDGRLKSGAQAYAKQLGIDHTVIFAGLTRDIAAHLAISDAVLMVSSYEGTSNVIPEAQMLGVPGVVTGVGGLPEALIPGETGIVLPADPSPAQIADGIEQALDPAWRDGVHARAQSFARERFGVAQMVAATAGAYRG